MSPRCLSAPLGTRLPTLAGTPGFSRVRSGRFCPRAGGTVELSDFTSAPAVNNVRIEGIGCDVSVFDHADGMPVAEVDGAVVATTGDADRTALLLAAADAIGECRSDRDVINLRGGLVVPGAPGGSAVDGDESALVAHEKNNVGVVGIDPEILIVVAAGRAAKSEPGFAAVGGLHGHCARAIHYVCILCINSGNWEIAAADAA